MDDLVTETETETVAVDNDAQSDPYANYDLYFVTRDGQHGFQISGSGFMYAPPYPNEQLPFGRRDLETGIPSDGWPVDPWLRVTPEFWVAYSNRLNEYTPPGPNGEFVPPERLRPGADDVMEPSVY